MVLLEKTKTHFGKKKKKKKEKKKKEITFDVYIIKGFLKFFFKFWSHFAKFWPSEAEISTGRDFGGSDFKKKISKKYFSILVPNMCQISSESIQ